MGGRTYRLTLCYDGTRYRGWQRLPDTELTIQGKVEAALSKIFGSPIEISGSGRTDAGVHARAQVASFHAPERPLAPLLRQLRQLLPPDIGAVSLEYAAERFHARLCATEKTYVYRLWNSDAPDVFERRWRIPLPDRLDFAAMERAASHLTGTHEFLAFCSNRHFKKSSVRTLKRLEIHRDGAEVRFVLTADGFLYNMARILVGTLLEVGMGKREAASVPSLFEEKTRALAGPTAPAGGLCLWEVRYD